MMRRALLIAVAAVALQAAVHAEVEFLGPDLGKDDSLLFAARTDLPGGGACDSLFRAELGSSTLTQLTVYPESISLVDGGRRLQIQNRLGLFRTDSSLQHLAPVEGWPAFVRGAAVTAGRLLPAAPSPDGAWAITTEKTSPAYCRLVLVEIATGARVPVADSVESEVVEFPARWSPDSRFFVYSKGGNLYYYGIEQLRGGRVLGEEDRRIGPGGIHSARWGRDSSLYYLRGTSLYRVLTAELFPQALYRGLAGMGALAGVLPFPYDPNFDNFWVSSDGSRVVLTKDGRNLFLLYLNPDETGGPRKVSALPYLLLRGGMTVRDVLWPVGGPVTVFTDDLSGGGRDAGAWRFQAPLDPTDLDLAPAVKELDVAGALELVLSPDGQSVAVVTGAGVRIRSYADWALRADLAEPDALHALWTDAGNLVVASAHLVETVSVAAGPRGLIALSQAEAFGRADDGGVLARSGGQAYRLAGKSAGDWTAASAFAPAPASTSSAAYRVFLEARTADTGPFRNLLMVRSLKAFGTAPLIPAPTVSYAVFPDREEPLAGETFDHGSRIRRREVALTFDALDSSEGLTTVLNTLRDYGLTATFFVNGEFIRRSPGAARLLAASGQETGSMFFTTADPTDARFAADRDYIRRGLAKTEDEWFAATGKELGLRWHTPYYSVNDDIIGAGASMNYLYVGRDVDCLDWVSLADAVHLPGSYLDAHSIVERILAAVKPGSIVPIRIGLPEGGRTDYLFLELPLLVNALEDLGYDIVPVSTLVEHAE
jgi:peptidoglycan/xylan/chitin deacetylase (PgdA/CDA1 family)